MACGSRDGEDGEEPSGLFGWCETAVAVDAGPRELRRVVQDTLEQAGLLAPPVSLRVEPPR